MSAVEQWRPTVGVFGFEVSDLGRIRGIDRVIAYRDGRHRPVKARMRKLVLTHGSGYFHVMLSGKMLYVHRLVAMAFVPGYRDGLQVNHKDGDRKNNLPENLEWVTCSENGKHAYRVLGKVNCFKGKTGSQHPLSKSVIAIPVSGGDSLVFAGMSEAGRHGFDAGSICMCVKGKRPTHRGYRWALA